MRDKILSTELIYRRDYLADHRVRTLLSHVNVFRLSLPAHLRRPVQYLGGKDKDIDGDLITAIMITHGCVLTELCAFGITNHRAAMLLCEPLITKETWTTDLARVGLAAIRAVLSLLYDSKLEADFKL